MKTIAKLIKVALQNSKHFLNARSAVLLTFIIIVVLLANCKKEDVIEPLSDDSPIPVTTLLSKKVTTAPTIDGSIDALWANIPKLTTVAIVPSAGADAGNPGWDVFEGVVNDNYSVTMRSVYDDNNIYFLIEYDDPTEDLDRQSWYFDPATKLWEQEEKYPSKPDNNGKWYYEDKFAFQWNINNSVSGWDATTCQKSCHTELDYASHSNRSALHYTNAPGELIDTWHWKSVRTNFYNQLDDKYFDDQEFPKGGRKGDTKTGGGYSNNKQDLPVTDASGDTVTVPKYIIAGQTDYYWITAAEISGGTAELVTAVDSNGVLTYASGTIDPAVGGYEQGTGTKRFPSVTIDAFQGGRGDVNAKGVHTGSGWVLEISRTLTTADAGTQDIAFDTNGDYMFGIAVFDNTSIAHATKKNLKLEFE